MMHIISGEFKVKVEYLEALIEMSLKLIPQSLEEPGCISYSFLEDQARPGQFLFFERWENSDAIDQHFIKPYFKQIAEAFPEMIEGEATTEIHEISSTKQV